MIVAQRRRQEIPCGAAADVDAVRVEGVELGRGEKEEAVAEALLEGQAVHGGVEAGAEGLAVDQVEEAELAEPVVLGGAGLPRLPLPFPPRAQAAGGAPGGPPWKLVV